MTQITQLLRSALAQLRPNANRPPNIWGAGVTGARLRRAWRGSRARLRRWG